MPRARGGWGEGGDPARTAARRASSHPPAFRVLPKGGLAGSQPDRVRSHVPGGAEVGRSMVGSHVARVIAQGSLVISQGQHIGSFHRHDFPRGLALAAYRIDSDDRSLDGAQVRQPGDGGDLARRCGSPAGPSASAPTATRSFCRWRSPPPRYGQCRLLPGRHREQAQQQAPLQRVDHAEQAGEGPAGLWNGREKRQTCQTPSYPMPAPTWQPPLPRMEERHRFNILASCHVPIHRSLYKRSF